ncbi:hexokinase 3 [Actinidia rufa]|uniref:Phosphotransferase n=1 Tax=Actinidia rufa TaxID=165716 RepID=A0A7J0EIE7_9ERIC|nr:hexokinase 3 [Actinidia rufa]
MSVTASPPAVQSFSLTRSPRGIPRFRINVRSSVVSVASILTKLQKECATPLPVLRHMADSMAAYMCAGLAADGGSDLQMILSYVDSLPTGRLISVDCEVTCLFEAIHPWSNYELFDFIASGLAKLVKKEGRKYHLPRGRKREIGFTFSFPVKQTSVDSGILIKWTKGFAVSGTVGISKDGKDVVACLNEAMERQGLDMQVSALVTDFVGTLAGARYWDDDVMVTVILGTETNACHVECVDAIPKLRGHNSMAGRTIINTEWRAFSNGLPLTQFDRDMDAESINPGSSRTIRKILLLLNRSYDAVGPVLALSGFFKRWRRNQKVSSMERGQWSPWTEACMSIFPEYRRYLQDAVTELLVSEISKNVVIEHTKDGSRIGAALLAASNSKYA